MGKAALIIVLGLSITLGFLRFILISRPLEATVNVSNYYSQVMARNVAHSAMNNYLKNLNLYKSLRGTFIEKDKYLESSIDTVWIQSSSSTTSIGDTIKVKVNAYYNEASSKIEVNLLATTLYIPIIPAAVSFSGPNPSLDLNGVPYIDGRNHDQNGNLSSSYDDLPGVVVTSSTDSTNLSNSLISTGMENHVVGIGASPSIYVRNVPDPSNYLDPIIAAANFYLPEGSYSQIQFGSQDNPVIVFGEGDLKFSGGVVGHGILIIDGTLTLSSNFFWTGMVFVIGQSPEIFSSVGTNQILGGVVLGGNDKVARLRGTADIKYSYEAIQNVMNNTTRLMIFQILSWYE